MPITGVENVTVEYADGSVALDRVTLIAEQGEIMAVLGPSGSGKSSLLRVLAGLVAIRSGQVFIGGRPVTELPAHERRVAMVFESDAVLPFLDVSANLGRGLHIRRIPEAEVRERVWLQARRLRLSRLLRRMPRTLSSGERSRVGIGHALVHTPSVFLFDEPLAHLDAGQRFEVRHRIADVVREAGVSAFYVTHDQDEAMGIADRIALLRAGKVVQVGTPRELYHRPADLFAACFVGSPTIGLLPARPVTGAGVLDPAGSSGYRVGARTLPLWTPLPGPLAGLVDQQVVLGIRPERVRDARRGSDPDAVTMPATVVRVEHLGADAVVTLEVATPAVIAPGAAGWETGSASTGQAWLRSRFPRTTTVQPGEMLPIAVDVTRASVFDPVTGLALWHPGP